MELGLVPHKLTIARLESLLREKKRRGALRDPMYRLQLSEGGVSHGE
jgi:hypothetical protein